MPRAHANTAKLTTPKTLLLTGLDAFGQEPFFHGNSAVQQRKVEASSLLGILECAFGLEGDPERSGRLPPFIAKVLVAAESLDADALNATLTEIDAVCAADAEAWFAAHGGGPLV